MAVFSEKNNGNETIPIHYVRLPSGRYNLIISGLPEALAAYIAEHWSYRPGTLQNGQSSRPVFQGSLNIPKLLIGYSDGCYGPCSTRTILKREIQHLTNHDEKLLI